MRYCSGNGDFLFIYRKLPCFMPFEGNFTNCNSEPFVESTRTGAIYLFCASSAGVLGGAKRRRRWHGVYAPLCYRVIISRFRCVFGLAVGVHRQICLAGYVDQDFCRDVSRGTLLVNTHGTRYDISLCKVKSCRSIAKQALRDFLQNFL